MNKYPVFVLVWNCWTMPHQLPTIAFHSQNGEPKSFPPNSTGLLFDPHLWTNWVFTGYPGIESEAELKKRHREQQPAQVALGKSEELKLQKKHQCYLHAGHEYFAYDCHDNYQSAISFLKKSLIFFISNDKLHMHYRALPFHTEQSEGENHIPLSPSLHYIVCYRHTFTFGLVRIIPHNNSRSWLAYSMSSKSTMSLAKL